MPWEKLSEADRSTIEAMGVEAAKLSSGGALPPASHEAAHFESCLHPAMVSSQSRSWDMFVACVTEEHSRANSCANPCRPSGRWR